MRNDSFINVFVLFSKPHKSLKNQKNRKIKMKNPVFYFGDPRIFTEEQHNSLYQDNRTFFYTKLENALSVLDKNLAGQNWKLGIIDFDYLVNNKDRQILIQQLKQNYPDAEVMILSSNYDDIVSKHSFLEKPSTKKNMRKFAKTLFEMITS